MRQLFERIMLSIVKPVTITLLAIGLSVAPAAAYHGEYSYTIATDWDYSDWSFGDNSDGTTLYLRGTSERCGRRGDSYRYMREILDNDDDYDVEWWIADRCGNYVRICVENDWRQRGCTTFLSRGWQ